jgi:thioredoxin-related protein
MGYQLDQTVEPRLLFFFRRNQLCNNYHVRYLEKFKKWIFYFDMDVPSAVDTKAAQTYNVTSVPTLILLNKEGYEDLRWVGGLGPDSHLLSIEIGMERAWWNDNERQKNI